MDIGQAYKKNEREGLGIELIIEFTSVQNSNHKCSWQQNMCGKLSVEGEWQLNIWFAIPQTIMIKLVIM